MSIDKSDRLDDRSNVQKIKDESKLFGGWLQLILTEYKYLISILVFLFIMGIASYWIIEGNPLPRVPTWAWLYLFLAVLVGVLTWPIQTKDIKQIEGDGEIIHDVNPNNGDFGVYEVEPEKFQEITVKTPSGIEKDEDGEEQVVYEEGSISDLETPNCKLGLAYECTQYDPEENVAYTTWMADATGTEIRASKALIKKIETKLSLLADAGIQEAVERPEVVREVAAQVTLYLVKSHQKATLPQGDEIAGVVTKSLQKQLDVDPTQIDDYVKNNTPDEYSDIKQGSSVNMDEEHRMRAQNSGAIKAGESQE